MKLRSLCLVALILIVSSITITTAKETRPPNIVFFLVDDLGWTDLGYFGSRFYESPNIDRLRDEGMKFTAAYTASGVCSPTRASIITGQYPARTGCTNYGGSVRGTETGLPSVLRDAGYLTFFAGKWHIGKLSPEQAGFTVTATLQADKGQGSDPKKTRIITKNTVDFIKANPDKPFFAYVCYHAVHTPLREREDVVDKYRKKLKGMPKPKGPAFASEHDRQNKLVQDDPSFAAMVEVLDDSVRDILNAVKDVGAEDNTVVLFFSDNGGLSTKPCTSNLPLRAGKGWYYEGGIRVPMLVKWPGVVRPGSECHVPVISTDFFPTILDIAGLPLRPEDHVDGVSITGLIRSGKAPDRDAFFWHYPHRHGAGCPPCGAVRSGDYKLIRYFGDNTLELYNVKKDIGEKNNLADKMPEKREALSSMLAEWQKSMPDLRFGTAPKASKGKKDRKKRGKK